MRSETIASPAGEAATTHRAPRRAAVGWLGRRSHAVWVRPRCCWLWAVDVVHRPTAASSQPVTGGHSFAGTAICSLRSAVVSARCWTGEHVTVVWSERRLVPAARFDELVSRAATVGVSVSHRAAQFLDGWCFPCGLSGSLAFPAVQVGFGGLAGGENCLPPVRGGGHRESGSHRPGSRDGTGLPRVGSGPTRTRALAHRKPRVPAGHSFPQPPGA